MVKQATKEALILIFISIGIALVVYLTRTDKIEPVSPIVKNSATQQPDTDSDIVEISVSEAVRLFEEKSALFVDARHQMDYETGHIRGSVNLYLPDQETWLSEFLASTSPTTIIITYCDGEDCHLAPDLAEFLFFNGYDHVRYLKNGWSVWKEGGYSVE